MGEKGASKVVTMTVVEVYSRAHFLKESDIAFHSRFMKEFYADHLDGCLPYTAENAFAIDAKVSNSYLYKTNQSNPLCNWCS